MEIISSHVSNPLANNIVCKTYFKKTLIFAPMALIASVIILIYTLGYSQQIFGYMENFVAAAFITTIVAIGALVVYALWFISATDKIFQLLNHNRVVSNTLTVIALFILPGISFILIPLIVWALIYKKDSLLMCPI
jgi:lysylphosphatidylglycerol synthetase-like protein (DUF2156 family)